MSIAYCRRAKQTILNTGGLVVVLLLGCHVQPAAAASDVPVYCGIHSLYAAMRFQGGNVALKDLVRPEYIGSEEGSTIGQLQRAAESHGMHALAMDNLALAALKSSECPVILHVMSTDRRPRYDHWLVLLRAEDDGALVYDAPTPPTIVPWRELAERWDGTGLFVSASPISRDAVMRGDWQWVLLLCALAIAVLAVKRVVRPEEIPSAPETSLTFAIGAVRQAATLLTVAGIGGLLYHGLSSEGILAHSAASERIARWQVPKVSVAEVVNAIATSAAPCVFVDARYENDYLAGHIPGAINIPVNSDESSVKSVLQGVRFSTRIIVYCQSASCKFDESVAEEIQRCGYENVAIFREGWVGWRAAADTESKHGGT